MGIGKVNIVDIVDENDKVIGSINDNEMVEGNYITRGVGVFVINKNNEIYLQKRSKHKYRYPHHWDFSAGGIVNTGKNYLETAIEELKEELKINAQKKQLKFLEKIYIETDIKEFHTHFKLNYSGKINSDNWEVEEGRWISIKEIKKEIKNGIKYTPLFIESFERLF